MGNTSACMWRCSKSWYPGQNLLQWFCTMVMLLFSVPRERLRERTESSEDTSIEEQIEQSKIHWSEVAHLDSNFDGDVRADNVAVFKALRRHPSWGTFFWTFDEIGEDGSFGRLGKYSRGELMLGEKFAEGGQAELHHAQVKWSDPRNNYELDLQDRREWALKVFKPGTLLRHLQSQWPEGLLQDHVEIVKLFKVWKGQPGDCVKPTRHHCEISCGILLKDGRFAFLMQKEDEDLRSYIDRSIKLRISHEFGPFTKEDEERIMYHIALGMDWLHGRNIVHRDLKASNVLCTKWNKWNGDWACYIADFECSIGVIGTGFFRAPEILQACKDGNASCRLGLFTKATDIYSYGMTCYEILTGKFPFEGHSLRNYDLVLGGQRPQVPAYVDDWKQELLGKCWQSNPNSRPTFREILRFLECNSAVAETLRKRMLELKVTHQLRNRGWVSEREYQVQRKKEKKKKRERKRVPASEQIDHV